MVEIRTLEVRFEVESDPQEAAFARLFSRYARELVRRQEEERRRRERTERERGIGAGEAMTETALDSLRTTLARAHLEVVVPHVEDPVIPLRFNPAEYQIQKTNTIAEIGIPGLESPPIQYIRGGVEVLSFEALVDTSDTLKDVNEEYVKRLRGLLKVNSDLHAPPIVRFVWDREVFTGVMEKCDATFTYFTPQGVPLRAKLSISIKEYRPAAVQVLEMARSSPDVEKSFTVREGDTLSGIAAKLYRDPARWREVARANKIANALDLRPGRVVLVPRLTP